MKNLARCHEDSISCLPMFSLSDYSPVNKAVKTATVPSPWPACAAVESCVVYDYRMTLGYFRKQATSKPPLKKPAVGRMAIAFSGKAFPLAPGANDIYALELLSPLDVPGFLPSRRTGVLPLQIGVYAASVDISPFAKRNPLQPPGARGPLLCGFFVAGKGLFFRAMLRFSRA